MSPYEQLASRLGIEPEFRNASGQMCRPSQAAGRLLLKAFGFPADNEDECAASLKTLSETEDWQPLPPVRVAILGNPEINIPVSVPKRCTTLKWSLTLENGHTRNGTVAVSDMALIAANDTLERRTLTIACPDETGYHRLKIIGEAFSPPDVALIVAPQRCYVPEGLDSHKPLWGISLQLYLLRSERNWGIGDFTDLKNFVITATGLGAAVVGLNPLHAMFTDAPEDASPYSPVSRLFLNILYIDVAAVAEALKDEGLLARFRTKEFRERLDTCRASNEVLYADVARVKLPVLDALHRTFARGATPDRRGAFDEYCRAEGAPLELFCRFQVLREHFSKSDPEKADWRSWPKEFHDPNSQEVERLCQNHAARIEFFKWTQWIAHEQLKDAEAAARASGMAIGLYRDLAVGANATGAETWANPEAMLASVHVGAPPDILNLAGQDWGLPPFDPRLMRAKQYAPFIDLVRANMRHAGGLRIDHVMALQHLYLIPEGHAATEGCYVTYPLDDLVGILALESQRNRCLVVGEDLGTVPEGFRERMERAAIFSYRVVLFEAGPHGFIAPDRYPALSVAVLGSHDLATMAGWWTGRDIDLKEKLGLFPNENEAANQRQQRAREKAALIWALSERAGLPHDTGSDAALSPDALAALHRFLGRTRSGLAIAQLDDLLGEADQVNVPGTSHEYPNWRRKYSIPVEAIADDARVQSVARALNETRAENSRGHDAGR